MNLRLKQSRKFSKFLDRGDFQFSMGGLDLQITPIFKKYWLKSYCKMEKYCEGKNTNQATFAKSYCAQHFPVLQYVIISNPIFEAINE